MKLIKSDTWQILLDEKGTIYSHAIDVFPLRTLLHRLFGVYMVIGKMRKWEKNREFRSVHPGDLN